MKLGKAFSDTLVTEWKKERMFATKGTSWWQGSGRVLLFSVVSIIVFFALLWRLFFLTMLEGHTYRQLANANRTRELVIHAPRGDIYDRTGKFIATKTVVYRYLTPCENDAAKQCSRIVSAEEGERLRSAGLPAGSFLETDYERIYPYPTVLSHVLGYVGEISQEDLSREYYKLRGYQPGDKTGKAGAEEAFEEELRGTDGRELLEVDATGKILRVLGREPEIPGEPMTLSLDAGLSDIVAQAFPAGLAGAVVVSKPQTGEILSLYSSPSYDSSSLSRGLSQLGFENLAQDPKKPLFDRAIGGTYPPGSTFKIVTAIAALEEKTITKTTQFEDTGEIKIGPFTFPNWYFTQYGKTEGMVDIVKAIQRSNDIFFYKAGEKVGITKLANLAARLGVGKLTGIELSGEAGGLLPGPAWKNERFSSPSDILAKNNEWYTGDTYHVAIGQGYLLTTPLQVNLWTNVIANGGKLCRPTVLKAENARLPARQGRWRADECKDLGIKKETINLISEGMRKACEPGGTGWPLFNFKVQSSKFKNEDNKEGTASGHFVSIPVACKTGTAEYGDPGNKTHAWFTVFAPLPSDLSSVALAKEEAPRGSTITGEPEISVTVLLEGAGEGSDKAAPVAKKILEVWFSR